LAHLVLALVQAGVVIGLGVLVFGATIHGNVLWVFVIVAFANTIFLNIGFIISGWANSPRAASGMGNVIAIPMMFFSGTFFPTSSLPSFLPELVQVLPLTPMLDAMRGVAIDGQALWQVWRELAMLAGWLVVSSLAAIRLFKFG
jgi:ABC-2 type transport system permease protein